MQSWEIKQICHDEGYQEGLLEGLQEGRQEGLLEGQMKGRDDALSAIIQRKKATGMTPEEIASLLGEDIDLIVRLYNAMTTQ